MVQQQWMPLHTFRDTGHLVVVGVVPNTLEVGGKFHRDKPTDADTGGHSQQVFQVVKSAQTGKLSCKREEEPLVPEDVTLCALLSVYTSSQPSPCKTVMELCKRTTGKWNRALFSWSSRPHTLNVC